MIVSNSTVKNFLNAAGKHLHAPEQKIILTATALAFQPVIDMKNKKVDEDTRRTATARNIAKIVAGAITGISIRYAGIWAIQKLTKFEPILNSAGLMTGVKKGCGILMPKRFIGSNAITPQTVEKFTEDLTRYTKGAGTLLATLTMLFTNFAADVPMTNGFTPICKKVVDFFCPQKKKKKNSSDLNKTYLIQPINKAKNPAFAQMERTAKGQ